MGAQQFSLDGAWALGEENFELIRRHVEHPEEIEVILEFGSGVSTARLALAYPSASITSIEQDLRFHRETEELVRSAGTADRTRVLHRTLRSVRHGIRRYVSYDLKPGDLPASIDLVLIDGPTEKATLRGREATLYAAVARCRVGAVIALDDYHRSSAKRVVRNWLAGYPGSLALVAEEPRLAIFRKTAASTDRPRPAVLPMLDNLLVNGRLFLRTGIRRIRGLVR